MSLPLDVLSSTPLPDEFYGARNSNRINNRLDFEDGGIGLHDPSEGLHYQTWWGWIQDDGVYIAAANWPITQILEATLVNEISFTFDQNCNVCLAYVQEGIPKLLWYDTTVEAMVTKTLDTSIINPRVSLDDKREEARDYNDIILAYLRNNKLCYRQQRDRFNIEYILIEGVGGRLNKIGMGRGLRMQFQICKV